MKLKNGAEALRLILQWMQVDRIPDAGGQAGRQFELERIENEIRALIQGG